MARTGYSSDKAAPKCSAARNDVVFRRPARLNLGDYNRAKIVLGHPGREGFDPPVRTIDGWPEFLDLDSRSLLRSRLPKVIKENPLKLCARYNLFGHAAPPL